MSGRRAVPIDRLSSFDSFMLGVSETWPQDIGALAVLDGAGLFDESGRFRIELVRGAIERRLHLVPRSRQVVHIPRRGLGPPIWVDAGGFDLTRHVRELPLEAPADEARLLSAIEDLRHQRLDETRPMWEMWFLTGLPDRRVGWFVRIHHTIADGMAAMAAIARILDADPGAADVPAPPWRCRRRPSDAALLADNVRRQVGALANALTKLAHPRTMIRRAMAAWPAVRELLAEQPASRTSLDRFVGPARTVVLIRSRLETFRAIGDGHDATVNDVLLGAIAGGLRTLLSRRGEPVTATTIRIYVPVSMRRRPSDPQQGNLIAQMAVPIHLARPDAGGRLRDIATETTRRKARLRTSMSTLMHGGPIVRRLTLMAVLRQRVNVTSASIPGPTEQLYLAGAPVLEVFPILPLVANEPLGVGAVSYAGAMNVGITADRDAFPDIDVFAAGFRDELEKLAAGAAAGPQPQAIAG